MNYTAQELADAWLRGERQFVAAALQSAETPAIAIETMANVFTHLRRKRLTLAVELILYFARLGAP